MMNIVEVIRRETKGMIKKRALTEGALSCTYSELFEEVDDLSHLFRQENIRQGMRVGVLCPEGIDYVALNLSLLAIGAVVIPIPSNSTCDEREQFLSELKADALVFEEKLCRENEGTTSFLTTENNSFRIKKFKPFFAEQKAFELLNAAFIRFTSGTTGKSKGVVLSHEAILERTDAANVTLKISADDTILWVLSMNYHFVVSILLFLRQGATIILCEHTIPQGLIRGLKEHEITFIYGAPIHYDAMVNTPEITAKDTSKIRFALSTTTSLNAKTALRFQEKFDLELKSAYGIIEVGLPFINDSNDAMKRQSVGQLLPAYQYRLTDKDSEGIGNIQLKGPGMFSAYFSPWQKADEIFREGWFQTGDFGKLDEEGFLYLLGRTGQVIHSMGMKIYAEEVKNVVESFSMISEAFVYGEKHEALGEIPKARIVVKGVDVRDFSVDDLRRFCYGKLASYKVPKEFEIVESLKKTLSHKVMTEQ
jgi:long-chain acyl-CoA synthetase